MNLKGSLPLLILNCLIKHPSHGYEIAKHIKEKTSGVLDFQEGTLYPALHKLKKQGLIEDYVQVANGRQRRYYRLTEAGQQALDTERQAWFEYTQAVNTLLGESA
jgi:transcriptional regulator